MSCRLLLLSIVILALLSGACQSSDPRVRALNEGMEQAEALLQKREARELTKRSDPELKPSSLIGYTFGAGTYSAQPPPEGIGFSPDAPAKSWCVVFKPDDENRVVVLEGYGEQLDKPLVTSKVTIDRP